MKTIVPVNRLPAISRTALRPAVSVVLALTALAGCDKASGLEFLKESMTQFRSLEGHARVLISLMSREQKVEMGIATPGDVDPQSEEIQLQDFELLISFLE